MRFGLLQLARAHTGATPDVAMVLYDLWSTDKLQRVTVWASFFAIIVQQLRTPVGLTAPGHAFATWVQSPQLRARVTGVKLDWRGFDAVQRTIHPHDRWPGLGLRYQFALENAATLCSFAILVNRAQRRR